MSPLIVEAPNSHAQLLESNKIIYDVLILYQTLNQSDDNVRQFIPRILLDFFLNEFYFVLRSLFYSISSKFYLTTLRVKSCRQ